MHLLRSYLWSSLVLPLNRFNWNRDSFPNIGRRLNFDSGVYEVSQLLKSQLSLDLVTGRRYLRERRHGAIDALLALLTRYLRRSFCFLVFAGGPR